jgi:hypothetical protein
MRLVIAAAVLLGIVTAAWAGMNRTVGGHGLSLTLPAGWHGFARPGQLQAADFALPAAAVGAAELARVGRGHVHLILWDYGPSVPYLTSFAPATAPVVLRSRDIAAGPLEGFSSRDAYAIRTIRLSGELLEVIADFGPKPLAPGALDRVNRVLARLRIAPSRVIRPVGDRLAWGGVALRLRGGWSGRIELPANRQAAQLVVRARRGGERLVLLELGGAQGRHEELPIVLTTRDVHRGVARRVFSTAGRGFDLSVTPATSTALAQANRLLATLRAVPRSWTFRSCDLTLRLPGTWTAAVKPRSGCYPVLTLRAPGVVVVLTELRPSERSSGRVVVRAGRRFEVDVRPASARDRFAAILSTLQAARRQGKG